MIKLNFKRNIIKLIVSKKEKKHDKKCFYIAYARVSISILAKNSHN